jgi:release factor glutamine methyltransferase
VVASQTPTQLNIRAALELIRSRQVPWSESASLDAQVLLAHILSRPRSWIMAHLEEILTTNSVNELQRALQRLEKGEPLPYILGHWEFYNLDFYVTPDVLIPRPETELLVEHALHWLAEHPNRRQAVDIGIGSGCIAVSLAANQPDLSMVAVDISWRALQVARRNISRYQLNQRVSLLQSDLAEALLPARPDQRFDLICANLPYIPDGTLESLGKLRWEPQIALTGGASGTILIERLLQRVPDLLSPGGLLILEIESSLGENVRSLVQSTLPQATVQVLPDLAGLDRLVIAQT